MSVSVSGGGSYAAGYYATFDQDVDLLDFKDSIIQRCKENWGQNARVNVIELREVEIDERTGKELHGPVR